MKTKASHIFVNTLIISGVAIWCLYESIVTDSAVAHCNFERGLVERAITNKVDEVAREIIDSWGEIDISQDVATHKEQWMRNFIAYTNSFSTIIRDVAVYRERNNLKRKMLDGRLCDGNDSSVYQLMETNVVDVSRMMPVEYFVPADKNWGKIKVFFKKDKKWWRRDLHGIRITLYGLHLEKIGVAETSFLNHFGWHPWKVCVVHDVNWRIGMNEVPRYYKLELKK